MSSVAIEVDESNGTAYIRLSDHEIVRTVEHSEDVLIDLDRLGVAVGIEFLDQTAPLPFTELVDRYHVHSDVIDLLRMVRPDVDTFVRLTTGNDGESHERDRSTLPALAS